MKALTFNFSISDAPKYLLTNILARKHKRVLNSSWALAQLRDVPEPDLRGPDWVKIRPRLSGICGSDLSVIKCRESLTWQPFASFPFIFGHEVCGDIVEVGDAVEGFCTGDRVTVKPGLGCLPRGIDPVCRQCAEGRNQLCENSTEGSLAAGSYTGCNADTAGFISEIGVAHQSQLCKVPDGVNDENAVLTEPFSVALHMVVGNQIQPGETVLVFGCGAIGLCTVAALKALNPGVRILAVEKDSFHSEVAREMGVEAVLQPDDHKFYRRVAELTGAKLYTPLGTKPFLVGGVDRVFDIVGSTQTVSTSLRVLAIGGCLNLLGIGQPRNVDWTPIWMKELTLRGIYGAQEEELEGEKMHDFDLALRLYTEGKVDLTHIVTHRFTLDRWKEALEAALAKGRSKAIKVVFTP